MLSEENLGMGGMEKGIALGNVKRVDVRNLGRGWSWRSISTEELRHLNCYESQSAVLPVFRNKYSLILSSTEARVTKNNSPELQFTRRA